jgi:tripartite-type tricarboxylate transporter receptor subunit TctC
MGFGFVRRLAAVVLCTALASGLAYAQSWPAKPVRIVVPFPPGGSTDQVARILSAYLTPVLGHQVIVENRGGASGSIGAGLVAKSPPDGYTFLLCFDTQSTNQALIPKLPFDVKKDFAPVMLIGTAPMMIATHNSQPYKTFADVVNAVKAKPDSVGYGTIGTGSLGHLAMVQLQGIGGYRMTHVPYKGGGPLMQDAIANHVPLAIGSTFVVSPHVKSGAMRPLAVTSAKRDPTFPNVPTVAEQGFPGYSAEAWWGVFAPAGTPPAIIDRMNTEIAKVLKNPDAREKLSAQGMDLVGSSPAELAKFFDGEVARWSKVIRENNIKAGE